VAKVQTAVLAVLGQGLIDPETPIARFDDPGLTRGDGCFEGLRLVDGEVDKIDAHLARMTRSAASLDIAYDAEEWRALLESAAAAWPHPGEAAVKLLLTRGPVGCPPTGYASITPLPADYPRQRREGLSVITLSRGLAADAFTHAPWLLGGVKTLSYAINMAALRHAHGLGADDVVLTSVEGRLLEGPTSTVVWAAGGTLHTPPLDTGILAGTTTARLFERAADDGWPTATTPGTVADLHAADAVWLLSGIRGAAAMHTLDGRRRGDAGLTARVRLLLAR
jgi:4-amino-4-deoxychorismate lyase